MDKWKAIALILAGILLGTVFANLPPSSAQATLATYKECVWWQGFSWATVAKNFEKKVEALPAGWNIVTGASLQETPMVLLCR